MVLPLQWCELPGEHSLLLRLQDTLRQTDTHNITITTLQLP